MRRVRPRVAYRFHLPGKVGFQITKLSVPFAEMGVQLFFVISGYIITTLLVREEAKTGRISIPAFYVRRFFRILPPLFAYFAALFVLRWAGAIDFDASADPQFRTVHLQHRLHEMPMVGDAYLVIGGGGAILFGLAAVACDALACPPIDVSSRRTRSAADRFRYRSLSLAQQLDLVFLHSSWRSLFALASATRLRTRACELFGVADRRIAVQRGSGSVSQATFGPHPIPDPVHPVLGAPTAAHLPRPDLRTTSGGGPLFV